MTTAGPAIYAGGSFTASANGATAFYNIAKWTGSVWVPLPPGFGGDVTSMAVVNETTGPALYVGGNLSINGTFGVAKWDGSAWSALGPGTGTTFFNGGVLALASFDDGTGPALYVGGLFSSIGGVSMNHVARWDGSTWSPLPGGIDNGVNSGGRFMMTTLDDGTGTALYLSGGFTTAGGLPVGNIAKYNGCAVTANPADFNGDGVVNAADLATLLTQWGPCPPPPSMCAADLNGDGAVNAADLAFLLTNWG